MRYLLTASLLLGACQNSTEPEPSLAWRDHHPIPVQDEYTPKEMCKYFGVGCPSDK